jgi:L-aminopeptidase/D-esterase-like protein
MSVPGVRIGHVTDRDAGTGCTVVIPPPGTIGAVDVRGGGPSTRELELLHPLAGDREVTALLLTGGSAFGLGAAAGVIEWCEEQGLGLQAGAARVPIVPAAVIYDIGLTGNTRRPGPAEGRAACERAAEGDVATGSVGAGTGATVGKVLGQDGWCKGGLGYATTTLYDGTRLAALVVVNAFGDVVADDGTVLAGAWSDEEAGFVGTSAWAAVNAPVHQRLASPEHTTLACLITDAGLTKVEAGQVARAASAGVCQAVRPAGTGIDGDVTFCLATQQRSALAPVVGLVAPALTAEAVRVAITSASGVRGVPTGAERRSGGAE